MLLHKNAAVAQNMPPCITESSIAIQCAWLFQQLIPFQISFMEGNHHHSRHAMITKKLQLEVPNEDPSQMMELGNDRYTSHGEMKPTTPTTKFSWT